MRQSLFFSVRGTGLALLLAAAGPALAVAPPELRGGGHVTDFTNCTDSGWSGIVPVRARMHPPGLSWNDTPTVSLTVMFPTGVMNFNGDLGTGTVETPVFSQIFGDAVQSTGTVTFQLLDMSENPTDATVILRAAAAITNFSGDLDCTARMVLVMSAR